MSLLNKGFQYKNYIIFKFYLTWIYHKFKQWFHLLLNLVIVNRDERGEFNDLSNNVPAFIDDNVVSLSLFMAFLKFNQDTLHYTLGEGYYMMSNIVMIVFHEVLKEVEIESYVNSHVALLKNFNDSRNFIVKSWNQIFVTNDGIKSISTL